MNLAKTCGDRAFESNKTKDEETMESKPFPDKLAQSYQNDKQLTYVGKFYANLRHMN